MLLDSKYDEISQKLTKIAQSVLKVCEKCMKVCEGVCESVWKYHHWISLLEYMLLDTQQLKFGLKLAKIDQNVCKLRAKCVKVCEGVCESVWN